MVWSLKPDPLEAARAAIGKLGAPVLAVTCDIRDAASSAAAFDAAVEAFGLPAIHGAPIRLEIRSWHCPRGV